jgi:protein involved in polysaccharide export with SLBB domain
MYRSKSGRFTLLLVALLLSLVTLAVVACGRTRPPPPKNLPVPELSTVVGPGDLFEVSVLGEKDLQKDFRVQPDGTVDFPYLDRLQVGGLEPQEIEELLKKQFIEKKILTNPQVTVVMKQYGSKKVSVLGAVNKPGSLPWTEGMKLVDAISLAGGLTSLGDGNGIILTRKIKTGTVTAQISFEAIAEGSQPDVPLQAGDTINVKPLPW